MEKDLTTGSVLKNIVFFSLPYLLSYFLQTLYGMADLFIIGQFDSVASITAVSVGSQVMHMLTVMIVGLAMGATVTIGKAVGGKQMDQASLAVGNTATLFMGVAGTVMIVLLLLVKPIVAVMSTPAAAVSGTITYLTICFIGIPFITAYNIISSDVFYYRCLWGEHFAGLSVYRRSAHGRSGSSTGYDIVTDDQCYRGIVCNPKKADRYPVAKE